MSARVLEGDALTVLRTLDAQSVQCCVTSPPYWGLRDYGVVGQLGLEAAPQEYVNNMVEVFEEVRRVLRDDGTLWLNIGDCYATGGGAVGRAPGGGDQGDRFIRQGMINTQPNRLPLPGLKPKDLVGIPWRLAFALQAAGWYLRSDIIWSKPNPMPESVTDRPTKSHEYLFLLSKSERYYYDADAIKEASVTNDPRRPYGSLGSWELVGRPAEQRPNGKPRASKVRGEFNGKTNVMPGREAFRAITESRNKRSVWTVSTQPFKGAHFATFPPKLIEPCILAGAPAGGLVLDPFSGAGTTGLVCSRLGRDYIGIELNPKYAEMSRRRIVADAPLFEVQA